MTPPPRGDDKPLAAASRNLRQLARERKNEAALKRDAEAFAAGRPAPELPAPSSIEYVATMRQSVDARTKKVQALRDAFERIAGRSRRADLERLNVVLEAFERHLTRRDSSGPK